MISRLRSGWSYSELVGVVLLLAIAGVGVGFVAAGHMVAFAVLAIATVALAGLLALFAARRSRIAAKLLLARIDGQEKTLTRRLDLSRTALTAGDSDARRVRHPVTIDVLRTYLDMAASKPDQRWLDNTLLRNASIAARDLLAWQASGGRYSYRQVRQWLASSRDPARTKEARAVLAGLDPDWALRLARVVALQALQADDRLNAFSLYYAMYTIHGARIIAPPHVHARVFQSVAYDVGEYPVALEITQRVRCSKYELPFMRADLLNPFTSSPYADEEAWLLAVNQNFLSTGLEPISLSPPDGLDEPFDRIHSQATSRVHDGPWVTVVVSAWQPGHGLRTAVASLISQSWANLEILVVDDASPDGYGELLQGVAAMDPRVQVIRQERNGGTYLARNTALTRATGEYMTFLDSDDWNHPRRIEHQVRALIDDGTLMSTTSRALRTDPDLVFNLPGVLAQRENASSLMFRLGPVREKVGFFDAVRKGADTEYATRIRRAFGSECHRIIEENLSMIRLSRGSLSREEFKVNWRHPSRAMYRRNYEWWHHAMESAGRVPFMPGNMTERPYPEPLRFIVEREGDEMRRRCSFDVAFVADLRHDTAHVTSMVHEARACVSAGLKVCVLHLESFRHMARVDMEAFCPPVLGALARHEFDELLLTDPAEIDILVIRDPTVMQFPSTVRCALQVGRVLMLADSVPRDDRGDLWYEPDECMRNAQDVFGAKVTWVTQSAGVRDALFGMVPKNALAASLLPMVIDSDDWLSPDRQSGCRRPVVGGVFEGCNACFPGDRQSLLAAYPPGERHDIRLLGGKSRCIELLGAYPLPTNWIFRDPAGTRRDVFLASCDFFVYFDDDSRASEVVRCVIEAMAAGCVVLLPPRYAALHGTAAIYCEVHEVADVVDRIAADDGFFEAQVIRGRAHAAEVGSPGMFARAIRALGHASVPQNARSYAVNDAPVVADAADPSGS